MHLQLQRTKLSRAGGANRPGAVCRRCLLSGAAFKLTTASNPYLMAQNRDEQGRGLREQVLNGINKAP